MVDQVKQLTVEDFDQLIELPENADKLLEFIGGEVVEVPSNAYASKISCTIFFFIMLFVREKHIRSRDG